MKVCPVSKHFIWPQKATFGKVPKKKQGDKSFQKILEEAMQNYKEDKVEQRG